MRKTHPAPWWRQSRKRWYVTVDGTQHALAAPDGSRIPEADLAGAKNATDRLIEQLSAGIAAKLNPVYPVNSKNPENEALVYPANIQPPPTVASAVAVFLHAAQKRVLVDRLDQETAEKYRRCLGGFAEVFGARPIISLEASEIESWAAGQGWSDSTQNHYLATVQRLLNTSGVKLAIHRPPMASRGAETTLTDEQFSEVLRQLRRHKTVQADLPELLQVLRETGARPQEMARLRIEDVDWANCLARIKLHKTRRHGKDRPVHFNSAAMAILNALRARYATGYLFRTRCGNRYSANVIVKRLLAVSERVGYRCIAIGLGRHSFATRALEAGIPDAVVSALLGHSNTTMVHKNYSHLGDASRTLKAALEKMKDAG